MSIENRMYDPLLIKLVNACRNVIADLPDITLVTEMMVREAVKEYSKKREEEIIFRSGKEAMTEDDPHDWECYKCHRHFVKPWKFSDPDFNPICDDCFCTQMIKIWK